MTIDLPIEEVAKRFHHQDGEVQADPWPVYKRLRNECPLAHSDRYGGFWVLSRYEDIQAAAQDTRTFSSAGGVVIPPIGVRVPLIPFELDPPRHTEFKRLLMRRFSPEEIEKLEPFAVTEADRLIDQLAAAGRCDLVNDYAFPLTSAVFGQLLSLPIPDRMRVGRWTNRIMERAARPEDAAQAVKELLAYLDDHIARRKGAPGDDILDILMTSEIEGQRVTHQELLGMCFTLVLAGLETTVIAMGGSLLYLARNSHLRARLLGNEILFKPFVEEFLRMEPPAQAHIRTLTRDIELQGQRLKAGERVMLLWAAANRDEIKFEDPDTFQADRHPNRHLTFGIGRHRCIGSNLASMEIRVAVTCMLRRFPDYRIEDESQVSSFDSARGPRTLPVTLS